MFSSNTSQVSNDSVFVEDVFSTYLYTGNQYDAGAVVVTNGIDLSGKGGLVWTKNRQSAINNVLQDSARGFSGSGCTLVSNSTAAAGDYGVGMTATSTGYYFTSVDSAFNYSYNYASWTFRKQAKFFDIVTYTGNGVAGRTVSHNLGSVPGMLIVKRTDNIGNWWVWHRSLANTEALLLESSAAKQTGTTAWNSTTPTSTNFTVGSGSGTNASGGTFVAYLFAHNAGGFGLAGTDDVITCGSFTTTGSGTTTVNLGYEPQWLLSKADASGYNWYINDTMRGFVTKGVTGASLYADTNASEGTLYNTSINITPTGFEVDGTWAGSATFIYVAIRRGPMKTPTSGTSVYNTATGATGTYPMGFVTDFGLVKAPAGSAVDGTTYFSARLTGTNTLDATSTSAEAAYGSVVWDKQTSFWSGQNSGYRGWGMQRAPSFMDVVCYTGNDVNGRTITHNLGVEPELIIVKARNANISSGSLPGGWPVYVSGRTNNLSLNSTSSSGTIQAVYNPSPTVFTVSNSPLVNGSGNTYVAYLFASCPGVSKVGSYSGTGATQTISCGFAARFVMIKRTDSTGSWWFWDTSRGMVAGTDPRLALNSTSAESNNNWVYTDASGFQIVTTDATVNASGGSYIYLCIS